MGKLGVEGKGQFQGPGKIPCGWSVEPEHAGARGDAEGKRGPGDKVLTTS